MFVLIDNYDSFTYNLYHYLVEVGAEVSVFRNDQITIKEIADLSPEGIILSPGPCTPNEAGICLDVIEAFKEKFPIFGVCLGHQSIAQALGATIIRGPKPMHAKITPIVHQTSDLFADIPPSFMATRYHSLVVDPDSINTDIKVTALSNDGVIQAIEHPSLPLYGVQFHPESIASEHGHTLLKNFVTIARNQA